MMEVFGKTNESFGSFQENVHHTKYTPFEWIHRFKVNNADLVEKPLLILEIIEIIYSLNSVNNFFFKFNSCFTNTKPFFKN